ncbi:hypothetical protein DPMN_080182 [Dreissena polymorpha]|uniref:Uncharacterized protein n=1 Tax=Dreissena polymorpha TaxID=45954 RepID=A0A9D3YQX6_DREPO|nr:hypothetical protein DPMN_080182 [Dreissena polymorpha]
MAAHLTRVKGEDKKNDDSNELENESKDPKEDSGEIYKEKAKTEDTCCTGTRPKTITNGLGT